MKKIILLFCLFFSIQTIAADKVIITNNFEKKNANIQDTIVSYLTSLDLNQFVGMPIDSFLIHLPSNYTLMKILTGDRLKNAHMLYIKYSNSVYLGIIVNHFQFMNPSPPRSSWNITLFRKENISFIEIYNGINCINGCN